MNDDSDVILKGPVLPPGSRLSHLARQCRDLLALVKTCPKAREACRAALQALGEEKEMALEWVEGLSHG